MFTVTSKVQVDNLRQQQNLLNHELTLLTNSRNSVAKQLESMTLVGKDEGYEEKDIKDSEPYRGLMAYDSTLEQRQDNIETELEMLDKEMETFQKGMEQGIENQTSFWCFGG